MAMIAHNITAVAPGAAFKQIANRCPNLRLGVIFAVETKLI